jgi:hypothetical protein
LHDERRLLQFSADYRVVCDLAVPRAEASIWINRFSVQLRRHVDYDNWVRMYVTLPIRVSFHLLEQGENTEQFSIASVEFSDNVPV